MTQITINPNPLLSKYLVQTARVFENDPIVILDIGARGGFNREWEVLGDQCRIFCFEPDPEEYERLRAEAPAHVTYIPQAVGGTSGPAVLYEAKLGASTGLYRTNMDYFGRLLNRDNAIVVAEHKVHVRTLDEIMAEYGIPAPNFIKLDVEGAEVDVLRGASRRLSDGSLAGILSEIRFQQEINGSPSFSALDILLQDHGLRLYNLQFHHQSRRVLPYPGLQDYRLPNGERFFAYTTEGQIQDGDAIYFRDLLVRANDKAREAVSAASILKLCVFLEIYSFNDCAGELILESREKLAPVVDCDILLDLLASGIAGRQVRYDQYIQQYFDPAPTAAVAPQPRDQSPAAVAEVVAVASFPALPRGESVIIQVLRGILRQLPGWAAQPARQLGRKLIR